MIARLTLLLLGTWCLASCQDGKEPPQDTEDSEIAPSIGSASDFPAQNQVTSEEVFPEGVLDGWGYLTTEVAERYHAIRSKKNYGNSDEAFYARFRLAKAEFEDAAAATAEKERIEAALKTEAGFKDYTQVLQRDATLYSIAATSNSTYLSQQPELLELAHAYLAGRAELDAAEPTATAAEPE